MEKGKAFESCLVPFVKEIMAFRKAGISYAKIAKNLEEEHGIIVHRDTIHSFVKVRSKKRNVHRIKECNLSPKQESMQAAQGFDFTGFLHESAQPANQKTKFSFDENKPIV